MGRGKSGIEGAFIVIVGIVGAIILGFTKFIEAIGPIGIILIITSIILIILIVMKNRKKAKRQRIELLKNKYNDDKIVEMIMEKTIWQGQTLEQLEDSLGRPVDIDTKVLKTKTKEIWKYDHRGGNRYGLRITLENGEVVGWDQKS